MKIEAKNVSPEIVAAISAAVNMMTGRKVVAIKIKRNDLWTIAGRQHLVH